MLGYEPLVEQPSDQYLLTGSENGSNKSNGDALRSSVLQCLVSSKQDSSI
jgi:hypothetical protein